jgi:hypothetical protein
VAARFLHSLGITPRELHASWLRASKEQAFGLSPMELARFASPSAWRQTARSVRDAAEEVQKASGAAQRLSARLVPALIELGESDDFSRLAPVYAEIIRDAASDKTGGFAVLCQPVKTEALRAVFPQDQDAVQTLWRSSSETVRESLAARPPPAMAASMPQGLEQYEQAVLAAASSAFGHVMGADRASFGSELVDSLVWLKESVLWVLGSMWKHVRSFVFVSAMIFAVVLTYCMFMDRSYINDITVDEKGTAYDIRTGEKIEAGGLTMAEPQAAFQKAAEAKIGAETKANVTKFGAATAAPVPGVTGFQTAVASRQYAPGVCSIVWSGMDCIVRLMHNGMFENLAQRIDKLFGAQGGTRTVTSVSYFDAIMRAETSGRLNRTQTASLLLEIPVAQRRAIYSTYANMGFLQDKGENEAVTQWSLKTVYDIEGRGKEMGPRLARMVAQATADAAREVPGAAEQAKAGTGVPPATAQAFGTAPAQEADWFGPAVALGIVILLGFLLGPVVCAALVVAVGAGFFMSTFAGPAKVGGLGSFTSIQIVMLGCGVATSLIALMPVSSDEAHVLNSLTGMVMHTSTQVQDYRVQNAHAQASLMRAQDAASSATYASAASGIAGAAALVFSGDVAASAQIAGAVHGGVTDTQNARSEAQASIHIYDATVGTGSMYV